MSENSCLQEQLLTKFVIILVTTIIINYISRYNTGQVIIIYYYYYYYYYCYSTNRNKTDITHFSYAMSVVYCVYQRREIVPRYFWKKRQECEKVVISKVQKWDLMLSIFS